jgi:hypothetical protein
MGVCECLLHPTCATLIVERLLKYEHLGPNVIISKSKIVISFLLAYLEFKLKIVCDLKLKIFGN